MIKTNVMRILEKEKVSFKAYEYPHGEEAIDGISVAQMLGQDPETVFKTLVGCGKSGQLFVFCIPVAQTLDLKLAAKAAGEKSLQMLQVKELFAATGYVRGGCSPIGMKKQYPTVIDASASGLSHMIVSAGKNGYQVRVKPQELMRVARATMAPLTTTA